MGDGDLRGLEFQDRFHIATTSKDVEGIENGRGIGMPAAFHHFQRVLNGV